MSLTLLTLYLGWPLSPQATTDPPVGFKDRISANDCQTLFIKVSTWTTSLGVFITFDCFNFLLFTRRSANRYILGMSEKRLNCSIAKYTK